MSKLQSIRLSDIYNETNKIDEFIQISGFIPELVLKICPICSSECTITVAESHLTKMQCSKNINHYHYFLYRQGQWKDHEIGLLHKSWNDLTLYERDVMKWEFLERLRQIRLNGAESIKNYCQWCEQILTEGDCLNCM